MTQIRLATPFDRMLIVDIAQNHIRSSEWADARAMQSRSTRTASGSLAHTVASQLKAYLAGKLAVFDLPFAFEGSAFEIAIWKTVLTIPFGMRVSYGDVARVAGHPGAHRGVARAMATLDFALFVPAHRVVGADGKVKGAAPDSMRVRLLDFESAVES